MILELKNPIPMNTPKGSGMCHFMQDIGIENDYLWTVIQDTGEIWTWRNRDVRMGQNVTLGRLESDWEGEDDWEEEVDDQVTIVSELDQAVKKALINTLIERL